MRFSLKFIYNNPIHECYFIVAEYINSVNRNES